MAEPVQYSNNPNISSSTLPTEVTACLDNARFLHLATSANNTPHVSLMNYTYLPPNSSPYNSSPAIIMTTQPSSTKTLNIASNPRVSLLVHDWVSHRPPTLSSPPTAQPSTAAAGTGGTSALTALLQNLNSASLSRISATINGTATLVPAGSEMEACLRKHHIENNTFGPSADAQAQAALSLFSSSPVGPGASFNDEDTQDGDGGKRHYIEGSEARVVVVVIRDGRISDWKGTVKDWRVEGNGEGDVVVNGT